MSHILFFDTETTNLIEKKGPGFNNLVEYTNLESYNKCRMVSICWKICDRNENVITSKYYIIKPKDFIIDNNSEAAKINGITSEIASQGTDIEDIINSLSIDIENVNLIVAHNILFDVSVLSSELFRYDKTDLLNKFRSIPTYCTCMNGNDITKIRPKGWRKYKVPKLCELYKHLFNEDFENAHNAECDVNACMRCYFQMIK